MWAKGVGSGEKDPHWRVLYKPPIKKRTVDLRWRILHGSIASNSFINVMNPNVSSACMFCGLRETIYHIFTECSRLSDFFAFLSMVFKLFKITFSEPVFIMGAGYQKKGKDKWQLVNYCIGEAKMAIYLSRKTG